MHCRVIRSRITCDHVKSTAEDDLRKKIEEIYGPKGSTTHRKKPHAKDSFCTVTPLLLLEFG